MLSCCGEFNDALATYILQNREAVLERNREIVFRNMAIAQEWIDSEPRVTWQAPKGVSVAYIQWDIPMDDEEFCIKLLKEEGVLLVPGCEGAAEEAVAKFLVGEKQGDPTLLEIGREEDPDDPMACMHDCAKCSGCGPSELLKSIPVEEVK